MEMLSPALLQVVKKKTGIHFGIFSVLRGDINTNCGHPKKMKKSWVENLLNQTQ